MNITGSGITPFTQKIKTDFVPQTKLALMWQQVSNGNFFATDRGSAEDIYNSEIRIYGSEADINTFILEVEANRDADSNYITLASFNDTEKIFGANIDYSSPANATIISLGKKFQGSWKGFGLPLKVHALSPSFSGSASLPLFTNLYVGYEGDNDLTINKIDSYTGIYSYLDNKSDIGLFTGTFIFSTANMILLRNYIRTQRGGNFTITGIDGVTYPFGKRRNITYPFTAKLISWEDLGMRDVDRWDIRLTFSEVI